MGFAADEAELCDLLWSDVDSRSWGSVTESFGPEGYVQLLQKVWCRCARCNPGECLAVGLWIFPARNRERVLLSKSTLGLVISRSCSLRRRAREPSLPTPEGGLPFQFLAMPSGPATAEAIRSAASRKRRRLHRNSGVSCRGPRPSMLSFCELRFESFPDLEERRQEGACERLESLGRQPDIRTTQGGVGRPGRGEEVFQRDTPKVFQGATETGSTKAPHSFLIL